MSHTQRPTPSATKTAPSVEVAGSGKKQDAHDEERRNQLLVEQTVAPFNVFAGSGRKHVVRRVTP